MFPLALLNASSPSSPPVDPSLTKLLLNFEGANGSTTFTDESPSAHPITIGADSPVITTTEKPFGSSSLSLNGSSYLQTDLSSDFNLTGKQVFTLEFFMLAPSFQCAKSPLSMRNAGVYCPIEVRGDGTLFVGNAAINSWASTSLSSGVALTPNAWHHVRIVGDGNTLKVYINGVNNNGGMAHPNWVSSNQKIYIGRGGDGFFTGNIKGVRLRYEVLNTGNFTPPTAPFTY